MNTLSKITGLAAAALLSTVALASAADLRRPAPPPPAFVPPPAPIAAYNWNGVYFGINGGWGWGNSNWEDETLAVTAADYDTDGGLIGGTIGANWQGGGWVLGVEGDIDWADINGSAACSVNAIGTACDSQIEWLGTGRIRLGMAAGNFLIYGTGGVAFGSVDAGTDEPTRDRNTRVGWTAGAGVEAALTGNFSVKAEWLYYDLGRDAHVVTSTPDNANIKETGNLFRVGLNWRM